MIGRRIVATLISTYLVPCNGLSQELPDSSLTKYAVHIKMTGKSWTGYGIYLGSGLVLTAEHVTRPVWLTQPKVLIAGQALQATAVKKAISNNRLTLLKVDQTKLSPELRGPQISLCMVPPYPGQAVVTVIPERIAKFDHTCAGVSPEKYSVPVFYVDQRRGDHGQFRVWRF